MLSLDERLLVGMKILERLRPGLSSLRIHRNRIRRPKSLVDDTEQTPPNTVLEGLTDDLGNNPSLPSLQELLRAVGSVLPYSAVLGLCQDGLPFLLDLTDPAPGGILVIGDAGSGKTRLLSAMLASITILNPPDLVAHSIITPNPDEYQNISETDNCQHILSPGAEFIDDLIEELVGITEDRRRGAPHDTAWVLVVDDLASCLQSLSRETFQRLYWLIRHGPRSRVWIIASIKTDFLEQVDHHVLSAFRTRLFGCVLDNAMVGYLTGDHLLDLESLDGGDQFFVPYGDEWLRLWVCDPEPWDEPDSKG